MGVAFHIVLFVVTLTLYGWYWAYQAQKKMKQETGEGLGGVLGLVVWVLLNPVSAFVIPSEVGGLYRKAGREAPVRGLTGLWLFPFGLLIVPAIVWFVKVQRALDRAKVSGPQADRRLRGRAREDADRALGPVGDRAREAGVRRAPARRPRARRRRRRSCGSEPPTRGRSRASRRPAARTTCSPRASVPGSTARFRSSSTSTATRTLRSGCTTASGTSRASRRPASRSSTTRRRWRIVFVTPDSAPQDEETDAARRPPAERRRAGGDGGQRRRRLRRPA